MIESYLWLACTPMSCPFGCDGYTADGSSVRERWKKAPKPRRGHCIRSFRKPSPPSSVALASVVCTATAPSIRPCCCLSLNTNPMSSETNTNYSRGWQRAWVQWSCEPRHCRPAAGRESTIRKPHPRHLRAVLRLGPVRQRQCQKGTRHRWGHGLPTHPPDSHRLGVVGDPEKVSRDHAFVTHMSTENAPRPLNYIPTSGLRSDIAKLQRNKRPPRS